MRSTARRPGRERGQTDPCRGRDLRTALKATCRRQGWRAARDAHLAGVPGRQRRVQGEESRAAGLPGLQHARAAQALLRQRGLAQPALAPRIYRGVVPDHARRHGQCTGIGGDGEPVEWAVEMQRLPDARRRRATPARRPARAAEHVRRWPSAWRAFTPRRAATPRRRASASSASIEHNVRENFEQTREQRSRYLAAGGTRGDRALAARLSGARNASTFARRIAAGARARRPRRPAARALLPGRRRARSRSSTASSSTTASATPTSAPTSRSCRWT